MRTAARIRLSLAMLLVSGTASAVFAQPTVTVRPLVLAGDSYLNALIATNFGASENFAINNDGIWLIESDTDLPDTNTDGLVIRGDASPTSTGLPGTVLFQEGQAIDPAPATLGSFDAITINAAGNSAFNFFLDGLTTSTDSGIYYNSTPVIPEGSTATAAGLSPATPYIGFFEARINDAGQLLALASVDDPGIASTVDRAVVLVNSPALGVAAPQTLLLREGSEIVTGRFLADVDTGPHSMAFAGTATPRVLMVGDLDGATTDDSVLINWNGTGWDVLAREGEASVVAGRNWGSFGSAPVDINNAGQWVVRADLDGATTDDAVLVKSGGVVVAREGSPVPGLPEFNVVSFGTGALRIDDVGRVFYFAQFSETDTTRNTGLFVDSRVLVRKGVTTLASGEVITDISNVQDNFAISPNGSYLLFEGTATDPVSLVARRGTFLVTLRCLGDFNASGSVTVQDIFDFLTAFFAGDISADVNGQGGVSTQDIFDFLTLWFGGC